MEWLIDIIKEWVLKKAYATEAWVLARGYATKEWVLGKAYAAKVWVLAFGYSTEAWVLGKDYQSSTDMPGWTMPVNVSGDLDPDATCIYLKAGIYAGKPYYRRQDGAWHIWWSAGPGHWIISWSKGMPEPPLWYRDDPNIIGDYQPAGTTGIATVTLGYNYLKHGFVDRGDPAAVDWDQAVLTQDNAWHDLDCSSIVPVGAKGIVFALRVRNNLVNKLFSLRKNGNVNSVNISTLATEISNVWNGDDPVCPCDNNRFVEYRTTAGGIWLITLSVKGWLL